MESCVKQYAVPQLELILHARKLERELQQVTAERDRYLTVVGEHLTTLATARDEAWALRARVAEQEHELEAADKDRRHWRLASQAAEQRVAESDTPAKHGGSAH